MFVWDALDAPVEDPRNRATCDAWVALWPRPRSMARAVRWDGIPLKH